MFKPHSGNVAERSIYKFKSPAIKPRSKPSSSHACCGEGP